MRAVVQRVTSASVTVGENVVGQIGCGLMVLLGVEKGDTESDARHLADKTAGLRIFDDEAGKMNLGLQDTGGQVLVVSQFTLCGDARKGRRPSFVDAADPATGNRLYESFVSSLREQGISVATGQFQANMQVALINDGPVTILLDSNRQF